MTGGYIILVGLLLLGIWALVLSYREDHPKKTFVDNPKEFS